MTIKTILFDLDGTLLPQDQEIFVKAYFKLLAMKLAPYGYDPHALASEIWEGIAAMVRNEGSCMNEAVFWDAFRKHHGEKVDTDKPVFYEFYENEFQQVAFVCGCNPLAKETVALCKELGFRIILATNPIFPRVATESRITWAGLSTDDFELVTTFENTGFCKPNPAYYTDILNRIGCKAEECLMVGNDVTEDMVAQTLGMDVFLLTDCLINKEEKDISQWENGGFEALMAYIRVKAGEI